MKLLYFILTSLLVIILSICSINYREMFTINLEEKQKKTKSIKKNPYLWPSKKAKKVHHVHPTLLYYNSNGDILPVEHGHKITESSSSSGDNNKFGSNKKFMFGQKVNNADYVLKSKKKDRKLKKGEIYHYSMPLPLNEDKEIIDITSNSKYLSPALWKKVKDENAEGYLYPYNITNRFNKNAIDIDMPYGKQVHDKLQEQNPSDSRYFTGKKHTHNHSDNHGSVKEKWRLKKRKKKGN